MHVYTDNMTDVESSAPEAGRERQSRKTQLLNRLGKLEEESQTPGRVKVRQRCTEAVPASLNSQPYWPGCCSRSTGSEEAAGRPLGVPNKTPVLRTLGWA